MTVLERGHDPALSQGVVKLTKEQGHALLAPRNPRVKPLSLKDLLKKMDVSESTGATSGVKSQLETGSGAVKEREKITARGKSGGESFLGAKQWLGWGWGSDD